MTFWADNIKFIKDIQDSKYKKIEDAIEELNEQIQKLGEDKDNKKARELFIEASRTLEIIDVTEMETLGETMFKDMPENNEKTKEQNRLQEVKGAYEQARNKINEAKKKFGL